MGTVMAGDIAFLFSAFFLLFCVGFRCFAVAFDETQTWPVVDTRFDGTRLPIVVLEHGMERTWQSWDGGKIGRT